jgi:hypothetical protein
MLETNGLQTLRVNKQLALLNERGCSYCGLGTAERSHWTLVAEIEQNDIDHVNSLFG